MSDFNKSFPFSGIGEEIEKEIDGIRLSISVTSCVNFALYHNGFPIVNSVRIQNRSGQDIKNAELRITSSPEICLPYARHIDLIPSGSDFSSQKVRLVLDAEYLAGLTEKTHCILHFELVTKETTVSGFSVPGFSVSGRTAPDQFAAALPEKTAVIDTEGRTDSETTPDGAGAADGPISSDNSNAAADSLNIAAAGSNVTTADSNIAAAGSNAAADNSNIAADNSNAAAAGSIAVDNSSLKEEFRPDDGSAAGFSVTDADDPASEKAAASEDRVVCRADCELTVLAFDQWHGSLYYPELLTSFVMPNHPEVIRLNARASEILEHWGEDPSLNAYQSDDPNRVVLQAAAVFAAIQEQNIVYSVPPAGFEAVGQRVRLCDSIMQQKMGTCLDLSLLYAACLESIGLNPILILQENHIFAGVWLENLICPDPVTDDASIITKRLAPGIAQVAVVECTAVVSGTIPDSVGFEGSVFDVASRAAERLLLGENPIECIIDVRRARLTGIAPLPYRVRSENGWRIEREKVPAEKLTRAPEKREPDRSGSADDDEYDLSQGPSPEGFISKKTQWERKLLDLGLRNPLINMHFSKTLTPIVISSLDDLESALSEGRSFSVLPKPAEWEIRSEDISFELMHELGRYSDVIKAEFNNGRLRSVYSDTILDRTVKELFRAAKSSLEENGASTLYLTLGLLRWYETPTSQKPRYAPIIMIPIDIFRKSAAESYIIHIRDDDPQINVTMLEKMKQDFFITVNGLDPLPTDDRGIDVRKVFTILRKAIMGQPRWDILESAYLGIFSFSGFVMWNDIRNRSEDLAGNKIVRSLMDGKLAWKAEEMNAGNSSAGGIPNTENRVYEPENGVYLPVPADASQLYAIYAACKGESFVLHGPPGTGKSQTITTLIANALAKGKTVLFVAEKMAALEVVQKRLEDIGLGPFCLELHSDKSKKKDVLSQLERATEVARTLPDGTYLNKLRQLSELRQDLNGYAEALHRVQPCGMTLYSLINEYEYYSDAPDIKPFPVEFGRNIGEGQKDDLDALVERLAASARDTGHPKGHPLSGIICCRYSRQIKEELPEKAAGYIAALEKLDAACGRLSAELGLPPAEDPAGIMKLSDISGELAKRRYFPKAWSAAVNDAEYLEDLRTMFRLRESTEKQYSELSELWNPEFFEQDGRKLSAEFIDISARNFLSKAIEGRRFQKRIDALEKKHIPKNELGRQFESLAGYQTDKAKLESLRETYEKDLGNFCMRDGVRNETEVIRFTKEIEASSERLRQICGDDSVRILYGTGKISDASVAAMNQAFGEFLSVRREFYSLLDLNSPDFRLSREKEMCEKLIRYADLLKEWTVWNANAGAARSCHLDNVVSAYENGMPHENIIPAFRKALCKVLIINAFNDNPLLDRFSGTVFNEKIEQFRRIDNELTTLTQKEIVSRLSSNIPDFVREASESPELGILQRAIKSGGRGVSIRKLFSQIPDLLPRLCPCMLMSPVSVAQYLDADRKPFDIVVFDEASQLQTCKAVGALARGRNAVIVGDPKQMPPTSFFMTDMTDEENPDLEDLESILDDCLALNMPQTHLLWHYRSRHESLIAFSNTQFYDNLLYTFPSFNNRESKVHLVHVDGVFERGRNRRNRAEAEAIINELRRRSRDPEVSGLSVGVVTFNISQQNLIDDMLSEACRTDSVLEEWAYRSEVPVFIKNLENVQGDERDVILFSVTYGPDEHGRVYMNFGPLNRDGGWRRLNVAVSRARCEMVVYSTLYPDMIDLSKTRSKGVEALKAFLEYAGSGVLPADEGTGNGSGSRPGARRAASDSGEAEEGIAVALCSILKEYGYDTDRRIGHSGFRIDIGVIDPEDPDTYLLGILLDGSSYYALKTVRDREVGQVSVLRGLGWRILRIWTIDWWDKKEKEVKRILTELEKIKKETKEARKTAAIRKAVEMSKADDEKASREAEEKIFRQAQAEKRKAGRSGKEESVSGKEETKGDSEMIIAGSDPGAAVPADDAGPGRRIYSDDGQGVEIYVISDGSGTTKNPAPDSPEPTRNDASPDDVTAPAESETAVSGSSGPETDRAAPVISGDPEISGPGSDISDDSVVYDPASGDSVVYDPASGASDVYDPASDDSDVYDSASGESEVYDPASGESDVYDPASGESEVYDPASDSSGESLVCPVPEGSGSGSYDAGNSLSETEVSGNVSGPAVTYGSVQPLGPYTIAALPKCQIPADEFMLPEYVSDISEKVETVIACEAPISENVLMRRVVQSFGIIRAGSRIRNYFRKFYLSENLSGKLKFTEQSGQRFIWKTGQHPEAFTGFRVNGNGENKRDAKEIPVQEAANALYLVLLEERSLPEAELLKETAKRLGYARAGTNVAAAMTETLRYAVSVRKIECGADGRYRLK